MSIARLEISIRHIRELGPIGSNELVAIAGNVRIPTVLDSIITDSTALLPTTVIDIES